MDLQKLFEIQAGLDYRITKEHPVQEGEDRLAKKILALQVELGELANEWRGFKFWSYDQEPRIGKKKVCTSCNGKGQKEMAGPHSNWKLKLCECGFCQGTGYWIIQRNTLLEEYVDCLHFFLSIGLDLDINTNGSYFPSAGDDVLIQFAVINRYVAELWWECHDNGKNKSVKWLYAFSRFIKLAELLGFTWDEIEQAYLEKNRINHERQLNHY